MDCRNKFGLRITEAADCIGAKPGHIEAAMRNGLLPFRMVGGERIVSPEDLRKYFDSLPVETGPRREPVAATKARRAA